MHSLSSLSNCSNNSSRGSLKDEWSLNVKRQMCQSGVVTTAGNNSTNVQGPEDPLSRKPDCSVCPCYVLLQGNHKWQKPGLKAFMLKCRVIIKRLIYSLLHWQLTRMESAQWIKQSSNFRSACSTDEWKGNWRAAGGHTVFNNEGENLGWPHSRSLQWDYV